MRITASDRSVLIRLASKLPAGSEERRAILVGLSKVGMEFSTKDALDAYLKEHPGADKSLHSLKKPEKGEKGEDPEKAEKALQDLTSSPEFVKDGEDISKHVGEAFKDGEPNPSFAKKLHSKLKSGLMKYGPIAASIGIGLMASTPAYAWNEAVQRTPDHLPGKILGIAVVGLAILAAAKGAGGSSRRASSKDVSQALKAMKSLNKDQIKELLESADEDGIPDMAMAMSLSGWDS